MLQMIQWDCSKSTQHCFKLKWILQNISVAHNLLTQYLLRKRLFVWWNAFWSIITSEKNLNKTMRHPNFVFIIRDKSLTYWTRMFIDFKVQIDSFLIVLWLFTSLVTLYFEQALIVTLWKTVMRITWSQKLNEDAIFDTTIRYFWNFLYERQQP